MKLPFKFQGFESPRYTMVPDEIFDRLLSYLSHAELKVLMYLVRRTFGFKKDHDSVSLSQICNGIKTKKGKVIDKGTGLSRPAVIKALKSLEENNIIITHRSRNARGEKQTNTYSLRIIHRVGNEINYRSKQTLLRVGNEINTQETVLQETDNNVRDQLSKKPKYEVDTLITKMEQQLHDHHSRSFYKKIAQQLPSQIIFRALGEVKEMDQAGQIQKSKGAVFTEKIKRYAKEAGVNLGLSPPKK